VPSLQGEVDPQSQEWEVSMSALPSISYADFRRKLAEGDPWAAAFKRIQEGQKLSADGVEYRVSWKHTDPDWIELTHRTGKTLSRKIVRPGDPLLLELKAL
jgi:hypothetical protein